MSSTTLKAGVLIAAIGLLAVTKNKVRSIKKDKVRKISDKIKTIDPTRLTCC